MPRLRPVEELRDELAEWMRRLEQAGADWVTARAARQPTDESDHRYSVAAQNVRRLERRIKRRGG